MPFNVENKATYTVDGIPYMWNTGDVTTAPSNQNKIIGTGVGLDDYFGSAVAVGSNRIVVGAPQDYDNGSNAGAAYVFDINGNQVSKITASDGVANEFFGDRNCISVGFGKIVIGMPFNDIDGSTFNTGAAYIFDINGTQLSKITAGDIVAFDEFGCSVSVGSGKILIGKKGDNSSTGSAYIFDLDGNQLKKITASDGAAGDLFGFDVAIGSGRIVVGAPQDDDNGTDSGSAYIYDLNGNEISKIIASDAAAGDEFGFSVAVGSGRIVVSSGLNDDDGTDSGSAYIYDLDGNEIRKITASDAAADDQFGVSVAVGSGRIVVGAGRNNSSTGAAYIFDLDGNQISKLTASDGAAGDNFGFEVAAGSGEIIVGAPLDDNANGVDAGGVYIYRTPQIYNLYDVVEMKGAI